MTELTANAPLRTHAQVMSEYLHLAGKRALDVGCGAGQHTRWMAQAGADVIGIDPGEQQLAKARAVEPAGTEKYLKATAEALPVADQSIEIVVFFNSLHHVPVDGMEQALVESHRVLIPGGTLYIAEPLAQGPQFELHRPVNDETQVRAQAYAAITRAAALGFRQELETNYAADVCLADFESFRDLSTSISPEREAYFQAHDTDLRKRFEAYGERRPDGWHFRQYIRVNLLYRAD